MSAVQIDWNAMISGMMANDNALRRRAEAQYHAAVREAPLQVLQALLQLLTPPAAEALASQAPEARAAHEQARALSAVLLRRLLGKGAGIWVRLDASSQQQTRAALLAALCNEQVMHVRRKTANTCAQLAGTVSLDNQSVTEAWPELVPLVATLCASTGTGAEAASMRATGLHILELLAEYAGRALVPALGGTAAAAAGQGAATQLLSPQLLAQGLADADGAVRLAALRATASVFLALPDPQEEAEAEEQAVSTAEAAQAAGDAAAAQQSGALAAAARAQRAATLALRRAYEPLLDPVLTVIGAALNEGDELAARDALRALAEVAEAGIAGAQFFKPCIDRVGEAMLSIAGADQLDADTRQVAVELLLELAEHAPPMMRRCEWLPRTLLPLGVALLSEVEGDDSVPPAEWAADVSPTAVANACATLFDDEDEELEQIGARAVDGLAQHLGGRVVLPHAFALLPPLFADADWRRRRAAVLAVALLGEGCKAHSAMQQALPKLVEAVAGAANDAHPRVRGAALLTLGQMSLDFDELEPDDGSAGKGKGKGKKGKRGHAGSVDGNGSGGTTFSQRFHQSCVPLLITAIAGAEGGPAQAGPNAACPRLRLMALTALANYLGPDRCHPGCIVPYLQHFAQAVGAHALGSNIACIVQAALTCSAMAAAVARAQFAPYYTGFVDAAKAVMSGALTPAVEGSAEERAAQLAELQGKAMESMAIIGEVVGDVVPRFKADALEVLQQLSRDQRTDILQQQHVTQACGRLGKALGARDFAPFLPLVIEPLLQSCAGETKCLLQTDDGEQVRDGSAAGHPMIGQDGEELDKHVVRMRGLGDVTLQIDVASIEQRELASRLLYEYACVGGAPFVPWAERVATAVVPLLTFSFTESVRINAAATLPRLLLCAAPLAGFDPAAEPAAAQAATGGVAQRIWEASLPALLDAVEKEDEIGVASVFVDCLSRMARLVADHSAWGHRHRLAEDAMDRAAEQIKQGAGGAGASLDFEAIVTSLQQEGPPAPPSPLTLPSHLTPAILERIVLFAQASANRSDRRLAAMERLAAEMGGEGIDEEDLEEMNEDEENDREVLGSFVDCIGWFVKIQRTEFVPPFVEKVMPWIQTVLATLSTRRPAPPHVRANVICIVDDVLEYGGPPAAALLPPCLPVLVQAAPDPDDAVRRAATYGLLVAARLGDVSVLEPQLSNILQALCALPDQAGAREGEMDYATDNAVAAVAHLLERFPAAATAMPGVWAKWQSWLPLQSDAEAARRSHCTFVKQLESGNSELLATSADGRVALMPRIVALLGGIFTSDAGEQWEDEGVAEEDDEDDEDEDEDETLVDPETKARIVRLLRGWHASPLSSQLGEAVAQLPQEQAQVLVQACSS